jgi:hypothetical protein
LTLRKTCHNHILPHEDPLIAIETTVLQAGSILTALQLVWLPQGALLESRQSSTTPVFLSRHYPACASSKNAGRGLSIMAVRISSRPRMDFEASLPGLKGATTGS